MNALLRAVAALVFGIMTAVAVVATFVFQLLFGLLVAALATAPVWVLWTYFESDHAYSAGKHGTMVVRSCEASGDRWRCAGSFASDDGSVRIGEVFVRVDDRPGELVEGWVRGADEHELKRSVRGWGKGWLTTFRVLTVVAVGIGVLIALVRAVGKGLIAREWVWERLTIR